jgi:hypothetical protein
MEESKLVGYIKLAMLIISFIFGLGIAWAKYDQLRTQVEINRMKLECVVEKRFFEDVISDVKLDVDAKASSDLVKSISEDVTYVRNRMDNIYNLLLARNERR